MGDDMKIRLKRRIATRSGKGNQPLNIKTAVERPILKLGLSNFKWSFYFTAATRRYKGSFWWRFIFLSVYYQDKA